MTKHHAKHYKCVRCKKQADVSWPHVEPGIESMPHCRKCVRDIQIQLMIKLAGDIYEKN
jgi:NAD-dependent SIR2 family protein deacetylase